MAVLNKTISFAMLGPAGSGKTVAGCTIFHEMSAPNFIGKDYFNVTASGPQVRDLTQKYLHMKTDGAFPPGSNENATYTLRFQADDEVMCDVVWLDYKGALLHEEGNEENTEYQALLSNLQHAAVLVILVGGDLLNDYVRLARNLVQDETEQANLDKRIRETMGTYRNLISDIDRNDGSGLKKPVVFYVTKSDMVNTRDDAEMMAYLKELLVDKYRLTQKHKTVFCHSTLGRSLAYNARTNRIDSVGTIKPEGFEMPILLTVGYAFSEEGDRWERQEYDRLDQAIASAKDAEEEAEDNLDRVRRKEKGFFGALSGLFVGKKRESQKAGYRQDIDIAQTRRSNLEFERKQVQHNNEMRKKAMSILSYIKEQNSTLGHRYAVYLNDQGEEGSLDEFFAQS